MQTTANEQECPPSSTSDGAEETPQPINQNSSTSPGAAAEADSQPEQLQQQQPEEPEHEQGGVGEAAAIEEAQRERRVTWQSLESQRRRFNYDIMPKVCVMIMHVISCDDSNVVSDHNVYCS